jgi:hypothetical protein
MPSPLPPSPLPFLLPATLVPITIAHIVAVAVIIALVAVACLPPSLSLLLPPLSLPSLLHATLVANAIALFVACHPYCHCHRLNTLALFIAALIIRRMLSSFVAARHCGCVVIIALLPATAHL